MPGNTTTRSPIKGANAPRLSDRNRCRIGRVALRFALQQHFAPRWPLEAAHEADLMMRFLDRVALAPAKRKAVQP